VSGNDHSDRRAQAEFEREVLSHLNALLGVAVRLARSVPEGEDLVQDTLVKAMRARRRFVAGTNMRAWLLRILTNTFINRYRRGGLEKSIFEGPDADPLADGWVGASTMEAMRDPESQALRPMVAAEIERALDELPDEFRLAVLLADVEELSYREISEVMNCPIGTVMSRLHRGRRLLRTRLYDQARALGVVGPESVLFEEESASEPVDLGEYRQRKGAAR
jgi:RNA polymerase sigma-70 factor (ECF subfamily)